MASRSYNSKTGKARLFFRYGSTQFNRTLPFESDREAFCLVADHCRTDGNANHSGIDQT